MNGRRGRGRSAATATSTTPARPIADALDALDDGARTYAIAAEATSNRRMATMLTGLSRRRAQVRSHVARLASEELALEADGKRGTIGRVLRRGWMRVRSTLGDGAAPVRTALDSERRAAETLTTALDELDDDVPGSVAYALRRALDDVRHACDRLEDTTA